MTNKERKEFEVFLEQLLRLEYKKINEHVHISYDNEFIQIVNTKGGEASVFLKRKTFEKIIKVLGYVK